MKTLLKHTFLLGSLGVLLASCETPFYIHTQVTPDLSLHRDIYTDSAFFKTSGDPDKALPRPVFCGQGRADTFCAEYPPQGFMIDFYGEPTHMMIRYRTDYNASFWPSNRILVDSTQMENPLLQPEENMQKHFRWFFTYYEYTATIKAFENLPVPLSSYLSPEEQAVFFGNSPLPQGWNGKESYEYLESINNKFVQWYNRSLFETNYDILYSLADAELRETMQAHKKRMYQQTDPSELGLFDELPDYCQQWDESLGKPLLYPLYQQHQAEADSLQKTKTRILSYFSYTFVYRTDLPGKLVSTNALRLEEGNPVWKADGFRLLASDIQMQAVSRKTNIWAFVLSIALFAGLITGTALWKKAAAQKQYKRQHANHTHSGRIL